MGLVGAGLQNAKNGCCVAKIDDFTIEFISGAHFIDIAKNATG